MDRTPETAPTEHEVRRQLDRMLESPVFASAPRLSPLLRYIVGETLAGNGAGDGTNLREQQIGFAVLDNYDSNSSAVRTYVTNLRGKIDKYYREFGAEDLILVEVPQGSYRAVFSYNPGSPADKLYRRGLLQVGGFVPWDREHSSLRLFNGAIEADPNHALAHAAKAEAELREAMYRRTIPPHNPLASAEASALAALRLQPQLWRAHVVLGAVHCCRREWEEAGKSFDAALAIAPHRTRDHSWYGGFLLATGREKEALQLARSRAEEKPEDLSAQMALGVFLYVARRFEEAEEFLGEVTLLFPKSWLSRIVQACVYLADDRALEATLSIEDAYTILSEQSEYSEPFDNIFPGLFNLCRLRAGSAAGEYVPRVSMRTVESACGSDSWAVYQKGEERAAVDADGDRWVPEPGHSDKHIPYWTPLQLALGCMGLGQTESAIQMLTRAVGEGDPLTMWLQLLPLFDPLRGDPAFQALIKRMNFPSLSLK